jgi:hypothetical protein
MINSWLHDKGLNHMKAAVIAWPLKTGRLGVLFISKFRRMGQEVPADFTQDEKDHDVKRFLNESGAESLEWVQVPDWFGITLNGVQPEKSDYQRVEVSREVFFAKLNALKPVKLNFKHEI